MASEDLRILIFSLDPRRSRADLGAWNQQSSKRECRPPFICVSHRSRRRCLLLRTYLRIYYVGFCATFLPGKVARSRLFMPADRKERLKRFL